MLPLLLEVNFTACIREELVLVPSRSLIATYLNIIYLALPLTNGPHIIYEPRKSFIQNIHI